jgi:pilus assembly protein Flp/PilA
VGYPERILLVQECAGNGVHAGLRGQRRIPTMMYMPREEGQGLVEYALILVLVAVVVIVILALIGPAVGNIFSNIVNAL